MLRCSSRNNRYTVGLNYAVKSGAGWSTKLVDVGQRWTPGLVLDSEDNPHMVFYDAEHGALIYATRSSGTESNSVAKFHVRAERNDRCQGLGRSRRDRHS